MYVCDLVRKVNFCFEPLAFKSLLVFVSFDHFDLSEFFEGGCS